MTSATPISQKTYTFSTGILTIYPEALEFISTNGKNRQVMNRFHIDGVNKEHFRLLQSQPIQLGFLIALISAILTLTLYFKFGDTPAAKLLPLPIGLFWFGAFLVFGDLVLDGLLGLKVTTSICLFLFGKKGYKISILNSIGVNNVEFFIPEEELFNVEELAQYKLNNPRSSNTTSQIFSIEELVDLKNKGYITEDEFNAKKKKILDI